MILIPPGVGLLSLLLYRRPELRGQGVAGILLRFEFT